MSLRADVSCKVLESLVACMSSPFWRSQSALCFYHCLGPLICPPGACGVHRSPCTNDLHHFSSQLHRQSKKPCYTQDRLEKKSFFNWFYFAINWGSCLAVTVVVYVQDSISWAIGFAIPTVAMALAIMTFTAGSSLYTHVEPTER